MKNDKDNKSPKSIDEYIASCPREVQVVLKKIRSTIKAAAPKAEEAISYQIPTFRQNGVLVHFAACKEHIGFYPAPSGIAKFKDELSVYKCSKGSVQFPLDQSIPLQLISRIVKFRVRENLKESTANEIRKKTK